MDFNAHTVDLPSNFAGEVDSTSNVNALNEDHIPNQIAQFYFVKLRPYEYSNLHKVESLVRKLAQDRIDAEQKRREKLFYRDRLYWSIGKMHYGGESKWNRRNLDLLQKSLDKLTFANNCSGGKALKPSSIVKEIDHHSLHFGLLHVSKTAAGERRILSKIKEVEKISRNSFISIEDYNEKIRRLHWRKELMCNQNGERQEIHLEMEKLHLATEDAIASAALGGKIWNSLGSKELIKQQIKSMVDKLDRQRPEHLKYNAKFIRFKEELKNVEDDLASLEDQQTELRRLIYEARVCISEWRAKQEEKNDSYNQYIELMRNAQELAKRKDLASLEDLCHQQVEKFRSQWVRDKAFRDDYITRRIPSLNSQCLNIDGRRRNPNEKPIIMKDPDANISKALKKALEQYQRETSAYLGDSWSATLGNPS